MGGFIFAACWRFFSRWASVRFAIRRRSRSRSLSVLRRLAITPLPQPRSQTGNIDIRKKPSDPSCRAIVVLLVQFSRRIKIGQAGCENSLNTLPACPFPPLCFSGSPPPPPLCQLLPRQQFPDPFSRLADLIIFQMPAIPNFPTRHNHDQIPIPKCRVYPGMAPVAYYFDGRSLESV